VRLVVVVKYGDLIKDSQDLLGLAVEEKVGGKEPEEFL
jgi:hypothetical protein